MLALFTCPIFIIMAFVKAVVYEEFKRTDGTYNVKIKVYHQKKE